MLSARSPYSKNGQATAEVNVMDVWVSPGKNKFLRFRRSRRMDCRKRPGRRCVYVRSSRGQTDAKHRVWSLERSSGENICVSFTTSRQFRITLFALVQTILTISVTLSYWEGSGGGCRLVEEPPSLDESARAAQEEAIDCLY